MRKAACPTCRASCAPKAPEINTLFRDALALLFPEQLAQRGAELEAARAEAAARRRAEAQEAARRAEAERAAAAAAPPGNPFGQGHTMFALFQVHATPAMAAAATQVRQKLSKPRFWPC